MMEVVRGLAYITRTRRGDDSEERFFDLGGGSFLGISYPILVEYRWLRDIWVSCLKKTVFGRTCWRFGGNSEAALLAGLPVHAHQDHGVVLQGLVTGFAGVHGWHRG